MSPRQSHRQHGFLFSSILSVCAVLAVPQASALAKLALDRPSIAATEASAEDSPDRSLPEAARAAEEQAGALYAAGRYGEALGAQQASVAIHRRLLALDPSQRLTLAASLHNLGVVFIRLGRKAEAIPPTEESLALYRAEAAQRGGPLSPAHERPLRNLVLLYFESNRAEEALPLANELARLHQARGKEDPLSRAERIDVLNLRASLLVALNRPQEALGDLDTAVSLARRLARQDPNNLGLQYGLAGALVNLSQVADLLGRFGEAVGPAQEAETVLRQLAALQPMLRGDWAKALSRLGHAYAALGEPARALPPLREAIDLFRSLDRSGASEPLAVEVGGFRDDLAHALETEAEVHQALRQPTEARAAGEEALALYSALARGDARYERDVERTRARLTSMPQISPVRR
jgi:tetratricopeptide (TPR) repeat protein